MEVQSRGYYIPMGVGKIRTETEFPAPGGSIFGSVPYSGTMGTRTSGSTKIGELVSDLIGVVRYRFEPIQNMCILSLSARFMPVSLKLSTI